MQKQSSDTDRLTNNGDGTITDCETLLMWTPTDFGKSSDGTICEGGVKGLTWNEATKLFGRGRDIQTSMDASQITRETYDGYKFSRTCPAFTGGYNDWRLPTVEEVRTLIHKEYIEFGYSHIRINREVFGECQQLWTANFSGLPDAGSGSRCAWQLHGTNLAADMGTICVCPVRLVRGGSVFDASFGPRKETFRIIDRTFLSQGVSIPIDDIRDATPQKLLAGRLLTGVGGLMIVVILIVLMLFMLFTSFGAYLLIPLVVMFIAMAAFDQLQDKSFYALEIVTPYKRFKLRAEKDLLKVMEQAISTAKRSKGQLNQTHGSGSNNASDRSAGQRDSHVTLPGAV